MSRKSNLVMTITKDPTRKVTAITKDLTMRKNKKSVINLNGANASGSPTAQKEIIRHAYDEITKPAYDEGYGEVTRYTYDEGYGEVEGYREVTRHAYDEGYGEETRYNYDEGLYLF